MCDRAAQRPPFIMIPDLDSGLVWRSGLGDILEFMNKDLLPTQVQVK